MKRNRWLLVLIPLAWTLIVLGFWLGNGLLNWLMPWFAMPAPALTRGELLLIALCLVITCSNWRGRR